MSSDPFKNSEPSVHFIVPGPLETLTGGFIYDRYMVEGLKAAGRLGMVHELTGDFPRAAPYDVAAGAAVLSGLPDRVCCVIDGLALTALGQAVLQHAPRLDIVAMIHHPLADETSLSETEQAAFFEAEKVVLKEVARIVVSSRRTAERLTDFGVHPSSVYVVEPGIANWVRPGTSLDDGPIRILSVGTLTRRKGHDVALRALADCRDLDWRLDIVGDARDAAHASELTALVGELELDERVSFHGEVPEDELARMHATSGLFLSAAHHEGFGMALADAVAAGLPVLATHEGAASAVVCQAAHLVPAGEVSTLSEALRGLLQEPDARQKLAARSRAEAGGLSDWDSAAAAFQRAVDGGILQ
ncbi:MAG: glycosyltransferase family 4 protein [Nisaea sp.]|uniref:glycosyltransferase family 4 protein n=1 Tax=Nisaea sp. TaxID=2024842 RepID=UPI003263981C